jgi:hypothetical protein
MYGAFMVLINFIVLKTQLTSIVEFVKNGYRVVRGRDE